MCNAKRHVIKGCWKSRMVMSGVLWFGRSVRKPLVFEGI